MGFLGGRLPELLVAMAAGVGTLLAGAGSAPAVGVLLAVLAFSELARRHGRPIPSVAPPPPPKSGCFPLTKRECEVAVLVAMGLKNQEIAQRFFRSERGVENHVQHCYTKLNIHNRVELTRWVIERGLLPADSAVPESKQ